jgi:hypothetical protein
VDGKAKYSLFLPVSGGEDSFLGRSIEMLLHCLLFGDSSSGVASLLHSYRSFTPVDRSLLHGLDAYEAVDGTAVFWFLLYLGLG